MGQLTDRRILTAKATGKDVALPDGNGLYLRVARKGTKSFSYRYQNSEGRRVWLLIGPYPQTSLAEARQRAAEWAALRKTGADPQLTDQRVRQKLAEADAAHRAADSFEALAHEYFRRHVAKRYKNPDYFLWKLEKHALPYIGKRKLKELTRADIALVINRVVDSGARVMANRVLNDVKLVLAYAVEQGHIEMSPAAMMTRRGAGGHEPSRDRALSLPEVGQFLSLLRSEAEQKRGISWQVREVLRWLLLTGQRITESLLMEWSHIDRDAGFWFIPKENTKPGRDHRVHLTPQMIEVLDRIEQVNANPRFVFAAADDAVQPVTRHAVERALARVFHEDKLTVEKFTPHDLRRTVTTRLADLGVAPHIAEKIANHQMAGTMAIYNRAEYLPERKAALELWNARVEALDRPSSDKVVYLAQKQLSA